MLSALQRHRERQGPLGANYDVYQKWLQWWQQREDDIRMWLEIAREEKRWIRKQRNNGSARLQSDTLSSERRAFEKALKK
jgi:hypothetical protein